MKLTVRYAAEDELDRVELDVWEFNEAAGFCTYRRYMELEL